jgi:hypothetical protein
MDLYGNMHEAIAGLKYGLDSDTESLAAGEKIYPGDPVFGMVGDEKICYGAHLSAVALTASANLVASNSITVTVNGVALGAILFETSSVETIKKIVNAINQNEAIRALGIDAFFVEGSPRAVILQAPGVTITAAAVVTGGASQATFDQTAYTTMKFVGVARFQQLGYKDEPGCYPKGAEIPVQTRGKVWVPVAETAKPDDKNPAYVILTGADSGKFTDVSASNYDCGCIFRSGKVSGNLALVELRGLK